MTLDSSFYRRYDEISDMKPLKEERVDFSSRGDSPS